MTTDKINYKFIAETLYSTLQKVDQTRTNVYVLESTLRILVCKYGFERGYLNLKSSLSKQ